MMTIKRLTRLGAFGLIAGILGASFFSIFWIYIVAFGGLSLLLVFLAKDYRSLIFILLFFTGFTYFIWSNYREDQKPPLGNDQQGVVLFREVDGSRQFLSIRDTYSTDKILLVVPRYPEVMPGMEISFSCRVQKLEKEQLFWLRSQGFKSRCQATTVEGLREADGMRYWLLRWRTWHLQRLKMLLPEPESSLMRATVLADEKEIPQSVQQEFSHSGLSHIMAISGMNMTLLIACIVVLLRWRGLSYYLILFFSAIFLSLYLLVIDSPASATRAVVMALFMLGGVATRRPVDVEHILYVTSIILTIANPWSVAFDLGWQMSFLALLGLLYWTKPLENFLHYVPEMLSLRTVIAGTIAAQVFIWPLLILRFQTVSLISPLANLFALPVGALMMIEGLLLPYIAYLPFIGTGFTFIAFLSARWLSLVAHVTTALPVSYLNITWTPEIFLIVETGMIFLTMYILHHEQKNS